jgi:hypothetical protein
MLSQYSSEYKTWLENLKVGDKVVVASRYNIHTDIISKITKIQIQIGGSKYRKSNGNLISSDKWTDQYITRYDEDVKKEFHASNGRRYLEGIKWQELPDEMIEKVILLIKPIISTLVKDK